MHALNNSGPINNGLMADWIVDPRPVTQAINNASGNFLIKDLVDMVVGYLQNIDQNTHNLKFYFSEKDWKQLGEIPSAPPLRLDIERIVQNLKQPCKLIYFPETFNGRPLDSKHIKELYADSKINKEGLELSIGRHWDGKEKTFGSDRNHWGFITEGNIEGCELSLGLSGEDLDNIKKCVSENPNFFVVSARNILLSVLLSHKNISTISSIVTNLDVNKPFSWDPSYVLLDGKCIYFQEDAPIAHNHNDSVDYGVTLMARFW